MRAQPWVAMGLWLLLAAAAGMAQPQPAAPGSGPDPSPMEGLVERGPVRARVRLTPARPVIGDPLTLVLEVRAEPGVELIMPEFGQSLDRFSIRDFVPREAIDEEGRTLATQEYVLSAPMSGEHYVPPIPVEFVDRRPGMRPAPEGEDAYELLTERMDFEVESLLPEAGADELDPPLGELDPLGSGPAAAGGFWLTALILGLLAGLLVLGWRLWIGSRAGSRRAGAYEVARRRLDALSARPRPREAPAVDAFFVELSDLVRHYLEDRFGLQAPELTTEEFLDVAAASPDLSQAHQGFLRGFLRRADQVKFARYLPDADYMEQVLLAAGDFLEQTRPEATPALARQAEAARA